MGSLIMQIAYFKRMKQKLERLFCNKIIPKRGLSGGSSNEGIEIFCY